MGLISHFYQDKAWHFLYSKEPQEGFYLTSVKEDIAENCKTFKINLDNDDVMPGQHHLKEFETFFVYTSQVGGKRYQYIILNSASEGDIIEFAQKKPKKIARQIYKRLGLENSVHISYSEKPLLRNFKNTNNELFFL